MPYLIPSSLLVRSQRVRCSTTASIRFFFFFADAWCNGVTFTLFTTPELPESSFLFLFTFFFSSVHFMGLLHSHLPVGSSCY